MFSAKAFRFVFVGALAVVISSTDAASSSPAADRLYLPVEHGEVVTIVRSQSTALGGGGGAGAELQNGNFSGGLDGWTVTESGGSTQAGDVVALDGAARLLEGDSFLVSLSQAFVLPADAAELSFTIRQTPGFDASDAFLPDAFEIQLLNGAGVPALSTWDAEATSSFHLSESGEVLTGNEVSWDGEIATFDVRSIAGTEVTLYFDLVGADSDTGGGVEIDDIAVSTAVIGFIRGDVNDDNDVNISDPIRALNYLFAGGDAPPCFDAADANNDSELNITDPIYELNFLFGGGDPIPSPYPDCGPDVGPDDTLGCESVGVCG